MNDWMCLFILCIDNRLIPEPLNMHVGMAYGRQPYIDHVCFPIGFNGRNDKTSILQFNVFLLSLEPTKHGKWHNNNCDLRGYLQMYSLHSLQIGQLHCNCHYLSLSLELICYSCLSLSQIAIPVFSSVYLLCLSHSELINFVLILEPFMRLIQHFDESTFNIRKRFVIITETPLSLGSMQ